MSSTFTSRLKLERQASGANSGNWGNLVNYVLNRIDSSVRGYVAVNVAGSANVTLVSNNSTSNTDDSTTDDQVHNKVIEFTGALGANINVFTDAVEGEYILFNNTTGSYTLTFGNTGHAANGVAVTQGTKSIVYTDGSTIYDVGADLGAVGVNSLTSTGNVNLTAASSLVLQDTTGGEFAALKANGTTTSYTLTLPPATGAADQIIKTDGSGNLSFADPSGGGTDWQSAIKTTGFTAVSGEGYFCNTAGGSFTVTLPASPSLGDYVVLKDYANTFDTAPLTLNRNSEPIGGSTSNKRLATEGVAVTLVYSDSTKGWLVSDDGLQSSAEGLAYACDYLVIAGGGGGGFDRGGGGGAGGYRNSYNSEASGGGGSSETALQLTTGQTYTITVGDGGADQPSDTARGNIGIDSSIAGSGITTVTSTGGGGGGTGRAPSTISSGGDGGSGGGAIRSEAAGSGTANQGFNGGDSSSTTDAGGGGGAGEAGDTDGAGDGGDGLSSAINGATDRGGGGGGHLGPSRGTGGTGGGGNGGADPGIPGATPGTANTGGGGGGAAGTGPNLVGQAGGSGVVILRMATSDYTGTTTGSPTVSNSGSDTILTFNASGSYTA